MKLKLILSYQILTYAVLQSLTLSQNEEKKK